MLRNICCTCGPDCVLLSGRTNGMAADLFDDLSDTVPAGDEGILQTKYCNHYVHVAYKPVR